MLRKFSFHLRPHRVSSANRHRRLVCNNNRLCEFLTLLVDEGLHPLTGNRPQDWPIGGPPSVLIAIGTREGKTCFFYFGFGRLFYLILGIFLQVRITPYSWDPRLPRKLRARSAGAPRAPASPRSCRSRRRPGPPVARPPPRRTTAPSQAEACDCLAGNSNVVTGLLFAGFLVCASDVLVRTIRW